MIQISLIFEKIYSAILRSAKRLFGLLEWFLFLRLVLKFLGASSESLVAAVIYKYSDILIGPFQSIFPDIYFKGRMIETATISAMIGYLILMLIFFRLLGLFSRD